VSKVLDVKLIKSDFPIFNRRIRDDQKLIYLDSAATSQKPEVVVNAERDFYFNHNAAAHRGAHQLAEEATELFENSRSITSQFIGARNQDEIVFTKSATEGINLVAYSLSNAEKGSKFHIKEDDEIVVSEMEHHANLVPWQELARRTGAKLRWFKVTDEGRLDLSDLDQIINAKTKLIALTQQSNVLGICRKFRLEQRL
jgi:cysteine desulfurase/selenocysteine lyase